MSKNTVLVHTQYEENYAHYEGGFHWKKKGGHTFQIEMDADIIMYSNPSHVFAKMLESQCSDLARYTYVGYDIQFHKPTVLGTQEDYIAANQSLEEGDRDIQDFEEVNHVIGGVDFSESIDQLNNFTKITLK